MIAALLLALAVLESSPKAESADHGEDLACAAAMARLRSQPIGAGADTMLRDASVGAMQFFLGRLSAFDSHTDWAEFMSARQKQMGFAEARKLAPLCFSRTLNLPFGDDSLTREDGR